MSMSPNPPKPEKKETKSEQEQLEKLLKNPFLVLLRSTDYNEDKIIDELKKMRRSSEDWNKYTQEAQAADYFNFLAPGGKRNKVIAFLLENGLRPKPNEEEFYNLLRNTSDPNLIIAIICRTDLSTLQNPDGGFGNPIEDKSKDYIIRLFSERKLSAIIDILKQKEDKSYPLVSNVTLLYQILLEKRGWKHHTLDKSDIPLNHVSDEAFQLRKLLYDQQRYLQSLPLTQSQKKLYLLSEKDFKNLEIYMRQLNFLKENKAFGGINSREDVIDAYLKIKDPDESLKGVLRRMFFGEHYAKTIAKQDMKLEQDAKTIAEQDMKLEQEVGERKSEAKSPPRKV